MSSHKHHEHLEKIKSAVLSSNDLSKDEKTQSIKHIDEWVLEDKAEGALYDELVQLASGMRPILAELGLI